MTSFEFWFKCVNVQLQKLAGVTADDLPDYDYRGSFDDCMSPHETAKDIIIAIQEEF